MKGIGLMVIFASGLACEQKRIAPVPEDLQQQIAMGESIYYKKECGKCHDAVNAEAPKLTAVYLAEDTMLAKYQLSHIRHNKMPPIQLTSQEISAVTQYVASLHAKAYTPSNLSSFDARCPVCGAALLKAAAIKNSLETSLDGKFYYFECPDCKKIFLSDPAWYSRTGYARANKD
jgi:YHS domain-containing protein